MYTCVYVFVCLYIELLDISPSVHIISILYNTAHLFISTHHKTIFYILIMDTFKFKRYLMDTNSCICVISVLHKCNITNLRLVEHIIYC